MNDDEAITAMALNQNPTRITGIRVSSGRRVQIDAEERRRHGIEEGDILDVALDLDGLDETIHIGESAVISQGRVSFSKDVSDAYGGVEGMTGDMIFAKTVSGGE